MGETDTALAEAALFDVLRTAVEQSSEAVLVTDTDLDAPGPRIVYANRAFTEMTGYSLDEVRGRSPRVLQGPDTSRAVLDELRDALSAERVFVGMTTNYRKDGQPYEVEWSVAAVRDANGRVAHYVAVQRDVTERERTRRSLARTEARFRDAVAAVGDAIVVVQRSDDQLVVVDLDEVAARRAGTTRSEALGLLLAQLSPFREQPELQVLVGETTSGRAGAAEAELKLGEGSCVLRARVAPTAEGAVIALRDVTQERRLQERLAAAERLEVLGRTTSAIAHDFNNYLSAILGFASVVLEELPSGSALRADVAEVVRAAERAAELSRGLLAFGRSQTLCPRPIDLAAHLRSLSATIKRLVGDAIEVEIRVDDPDAVVQVDPSQLERVLFNLVLNARDAMPGGGRLEVAVDRPAAGPAEAWVRLRVRDSGVGITKEHLPRLFEPYFTTKNGGHGLGLPSAYGVVAQSGGRIEVSSEPGRGATFDVLLPHVAGVRGDAKTGPPAPEARRLARVLVVEPDPSVRAFIGRALSSAGHQPTLTAHPGEALLLAEGEPFDVLVSALTLPHLGGAALASRLRAVHPQLAVVYTSAGEADADARELPADARATVVAKPFAAPALSAAIELVLSAGGDE